MTNPVTAIFEARTRLTLDQAHEIVAPYLAEQQRLIASHGTDNGRKNYAGRTVLDHGDYVTCCGPVAEALKKLESEFMVNVTNIAALGMVEAARQNEHEAQGRDAIALSQRIAYDDR